MSSNNSKGRDRTQGRKNGLLTFVSVLILLAGVAMILYPTASDMLNGRVQSRVIVDYQDAVSQMASNDNAAVFAEAERYNAALCGIDYPLGYYGSLGERGDILPYEDILNVDGSGIIGYITIDRIDVKLPVYHGTSDAVLNVAVGHLEGTSLPVGGKSTHCVLSAHRGLPGATLFSELDKLQEGDEFTITVLDRVLVYEVFNISVIEPSEVESLYVTEGEDLCTLLTCTPYGINTHRLLVTGRRVVPQADVPAESYSSENAPTSRHTVNPIIALSILVSVTLIIVLLPKKRKGEEEHE